jgi:(2Fe-2S) ferredoxin
MKPSYDLLHCELGCWVLLYRHGIINNFFWYNTTQREGQIGYAIYSM